MRVFQSIEPCAAWGSGGICATIGNFDGVHVGHQALVRQTSTQAKKSGHHALVITFEPHPLRVLGKDVPLSLNAPAQRLELLAALGVDAVLLLPFTRELAGLAAKDFLESVLTSLNVRELFIGHDFRMGCDHAGADKLDEYAAALGIEVEQVDAVLHQGAPVSSTRIRQALANGDIALANAMLGRPHAVRGMVVHGEGRGGPLLGFPTANMVLEEVMMPKPAAYATTAHVLGPEPDFVPRGSTWTWDGQVWSAGESARATPPRQRYASITSFGRNPTFAGKRLTLETFLLDFSADIYGQTLEVAFLQILREEKKFSGPQELIAQLHADVATRRDLSGLPA